MSQVPLQQGYNNFFDMSKLMRQMAALNVAEQQLQQSLPQPTMQTTTQVTPPKPTRGTDANPAFSDEQWGSGTSDRLLGYSAILSALAGATAPREGGGIFGALGRAGGAMGPMVKGELASRNAQDMRAQQFNHNQQMMELYKALLNSRQGG